MVLLISNGPAHGLAKIRGNGDAIYVVLDWGRIVFWRGPSSGLERLTWNRGSGTSAG
jgi:hypothetical protein